ncbi:helix-turn-helix domain-containing protein [Rariglobus hedericola]|uniref:Helix-turn-helix domain-containing protein n=1 Tax=Rariglobus hedericola TaxID=2597822 RepID=A0A556QSH7_9BACT|nr:helix-turn-helix domain-containing protein [Rariglobus hedericola]TSJ79595.1 helix-turn-helix domain-containing protein [Rariglobus hedericola]
MQRLRVADYFFVKELPVVVISMPEQGAMAVHRHEFSELTIITAGTALHVTAEGRYPIAAGDVFFIPPDQPHGFADVRGLGLVNVLFLPKRLPEPTDELRRMAGWQALFESEPKYRDAQGFAGHLRLPPEELERVTTLVRELEAETRDYMKGGTVLVEALFTQLVVRLARSYGAHASPAGRRLLAVQKAIRHIEEKHAEAVELNVLAKKAGMSLSTFKRAFKAVTGTSPIDYLLQVRLARACHLLRDADTTVTEAALAAGFGDGNYFARQFRARMGCTPREWREKQATV